MHGNIPIPDVEVDLSSDDCEQIHVFVGAFVCDVIVWLPVVVVVAVVVVVVVVVRVGVVVVAAVVVVVATVVVSSSIVLNLNKKPLFCTESSDSKTTVTVDSVDSKL